MCREERERVGDTGGEEVGDGAFVPFDREHLGFEAAGFADGARDEDVGEKLHLDALVAETLTMIAAAVTAVEREARGAEAGRLRGGRGSEQIADEFPGLRVERGIRARSARQRRLIDEDDFGKRGVARDRLDRSGVLGELEAVREEALVDDVVEEGGFAGTGDAGEADEAAQRERESRVAKVVLGGVFEAQATFNFRWDFGLPGPMTTGRRAAGEVGSFRGRRNRRR